VDKHSSPEFHPSFYGPRFWPTWVLLFFFYVLGHLPMAVTLPFGRLLGDLFYCVAASRRRIAKANIAVCFPELSLIEQKNLLRKIMHSTGKSIVESAVALWGPVGHLQKRYTISGLEYLAAAREQGIGVLLVGCHFTTYDVAARILALHTSFDMLYRKDPNPLLAYELIRARESFAGEAIVRTDTRQLIRNLRQGHVVWYAADQDYGAKHSVFAPFFGVQAATIVGTARVAQLGKALVMPFAHYRDENNVYHLVISAPLKDYPTNDDVADATCINQEIESAIKKQPDQYLWVHRRFKTRPEGEPNIYARK
jgi:Kdo2-lipid IVA lauroyltransferase/acyltransferase